MNDTLVEAVRSRLAGRAVREVSMFGARAFMVDGHMAVAARPDDLLVRVDPARSAELLARPEASQAEMGAGRSMGPAWVAVAADGSDLDFWIGVALERRPPR